MRDSAIDSDDIRSFESNMYLRDFESWMCKKGTWIESDRAATHKLHLWQKSVEEPSLAKADCVDARRDPMKHPFTDRIRNRSDIRALNANLDTFMRRQAAPSLIVEEDATSYLTREERSRRIVTSEKDRDKERLRTCMYVFSACEIYLPWSHPSICFGAADVSAIVSMLAYNDLAKLCNS